MRAGHDVTVVCQERHPERFDLGGARVVVPELPDRLLPVFVLDEYEGLDARLLGDFTPEQRDAYVAANAAALRELGPADLVFANHVLLGAPVGAASGMPYRVKAHGSELEYAMRGRPDLAAWGAETLAGADVVYAGSEHIRGVLDEVCGHTERVEIVPPGVDVEEFRPAPRAEALAALVREAHDVPVELRGVLRGGRADRPLLREAHREQGRPGAARGARRARRARRRRRLRRLPRRARAARARRDALHRPARAPSPAPSPAALRRRGRAVDLPRGVRDGRRGSRGRRRAAGRLRALRSRRGRRGNRRRGRC